MVCTVASPNLTLEFDFCTPGQPFVLPQPCLFAEKIIWCALVFFTSGLVVNIAVRARGAHQWRPKTIAFAYAGLPIAHEVIYRGKDALGLRLAQKLGCASSRPNHARGRHGKVMRSVQHRALGAGADGVQRAAEFHFLVAKIEHLPIAATMLLQPLHRFNNAGHKRAVALHIVF